MNVYHLLATFFLLLPFPSLFWFRAFRHHHLLTERTPVCVSFSISLCLRTIWWSHHNFFLSFSHSTHTNSQSGGYDSSHSYLHQRETFLNLLSPSSSTSPSSSFFKGRSSFCRIRIVRSKKREVSREINFHILQREDSGRGDYVLQNEKERRGKEAEMMSFLWAWDILVMSWAWAAVHFCCPCVCDVSRRGISKR